MRAAHCIEPGMPTSYADFVRLSVQICSKITKKMSRWWYADLVCRVGLPTRYTDKYADYLVCYANLVCRLK